MVRPVLDVVHGVNGYRKGCGCDVCAAAKRASRRKRPEAAAVASELDPGVVTPPHPGPSVSRAMGPVQEAVRRDFAEFAGADGIETRTEVAVALAIEIDERASPSVASACRQLLAAFAEVQRENRAGDSELAAFYDVMGAKT